MPIHDATNPLGLPTISDAIVDDRPCPRCSYNLRGLRTGDRCPECGTPIGRAQRAQRATAVSQAPIEYLRTMRLGAALMCIGLAPGAAAMLVAVVMFGSGNRQPEAFFIAAFGYAIWAAGTFLTHSDQPGAVEEARISSDGSPPRAAYWRWRGMNRILAWSPMISMLAAAVAMRIASAPAGPTTVSLVMAIASAVFALIGAFSFLSVSYYQALLADWAGDSEMSHRFRTSTFLAILGGGFFGTVFVDLLLRVIGWGSVGTLSLLGLAITAIVTGYCVLGIVRANLGFLGLFRWAIINQFTSMDINRRLSAKINARIAENQSEESRKKAGRSIHF